MASPLFTYFAPHSRPASGRPADASVGFGGFAHLRCMEPATTAPSTTTTPVENALVVTGVFEPVLVLVGYALVGASWVASCWVKAAAVRLLAMCEHISAWAASASR